MGSCIKLAITGGIGSGKSVVSHIIQIMGVPVYDCDSRAKELMAADKELVKGLERNATMLTVRLTAPFWQQGFLPMTII